MGQNEQKTDLPSAEKTLMEEKVKLEEQLKETMVRLRALGGAWSFKLQVSLFRGRLASLRDNRDGAQTNPIVVQGLRLGPITSYYRRRDRTQSLCGSGCHEGHLCVLPRLY